MLAVEGSVQQRQGFDRVEAIGVKSIGQQVLKDVLGRVVVGKGEAGVQQRTAFGVFAKEMKRSHELSVGGVEVSDFAAEISNQFEGRKFHDEVLEAPFFVLLRDLVFAVAYLSVNITAQFQQILDYS
jgi:hypothetical protein